ncbi:MAG: GrpB family protein [Pseudonocardiaceae bacterium]
MRRDPIKIVAYDPEWPKLFARERDRLESILSPWLVEPIEHIGSTAVPGLPAKPIIDMVAPIADYATFHSALPALDQLGWVQASEPGDEAARKWSICFPEVGWRTHHLHVVEHRSAYWRDWLAFRDHLRADSDTAAEYGEIKAELASRDHHDRTAYRAGKAPFICGVLDQLRQPPH